MTVVQKMAELGTIIVENVDIKIRSVEQALFPLVKQVTAFCYRLLWLNMAIQLNNEYMLLTFVRLLP